VEYALSHPALGKDFRKDLKGLDVNAAEFGNGNGARASNGAARTPAAGSVPRRRSGRGAQI
jgi:hypothetical protein